MGLVVQGVRCSSETQSGRFVHDVWWCAATQNLGIAVPNGRHPHTSGADDENTRVPRLRVTMGPIWPSLTDIRWERLPLSCTAQQGCWDHVEAAAAFFWEFWMGSDESELEIWMLGEW